MKYTTITETKNKDVATVTLNRPEVHNAFNETLIHELTTCFKQLSTDTTTRIIILTAAGKSFCAGADLTWMKSMVHFSEQENQKDSKLILDLYEAIAHCPKPVLGKINGNAFGGGVGLIAVCDISLTIPQTLFAFSEVKLGIIPAVISTFITPRIKPAIMQRLFMTGERFDATYAQQIGLIDYVVSPEDFDASVQKYVEQLHSSGPQALNEIKILLRNQKHMDIESYKKHTVEKIAQLRVSKEGQEGITAFLEKRKPTWSK